MVSKKDYNEIMVKAAKSVLIELTHILGEYHDGIVLIGGWVPPLLFGPGTHMGSIDVDLALDHKTITNEAYAKIGKLLNARGYCPGEHPYVFTRAIIIEGQSVSVEVDFLSGEYGGAAKSRRHHQFGNSAFF